MSYKLLIFDLDGTAIPNDVNGMPTNHLVDVITQLKKKMIVSVATGRPLFQAKKIIQKLKIKDPSIISGGTQIISPATEKILWEKNIDKFLVEKIIEIALPYKVQVYFSDDKVSTPPKEKIIKGPERIVYVEQVSKHDTEIILRELGKIREIAAYEVNSWTKDYFDIHITHKEATKKHALEILLKMLKVEKNEVVSAGDGTNDIPLFEMSGYKIAMGNAMKELKSEADFIAGRVDEDGLAIALEEKLL